MLDSSFVRSTSTSSIAQLARPSPRPRRLHPRPSHESVLLESVDAFDSLIAPVIVKSSSPVSEQPRPPRRKTVRHSREMDLFASASTFDSLTKSLPPPSPISSSPFAAFLKSDDHHSITVAEAKTILFERMHTGNLDAVALHERIFASKEDLRCISQQITENRRLGCDRMRHYFRFQIALQTHRLDFCDKEYSAMKQNISRFAEFRDFLDHLAVPGICVDFKKFCLTLNDVPSNTATFEREERRLKAQVQRALKWPKPSPDPYASFTDPETRTGQILVRFKKELSRVLYPDVETIADALLDVAKDRTLFTTETLKDELFTIGWQFQPFPFAPLAPLPRLPPTSDLIAKVFAPDFIGEEWLYVPFGKLARRDWPLRRATERLFPIVVLTNPFHIAEHFYGVIEEIGKCVQRVIIRGGGTAGFVEIDFDQMFVLMILCLLTSGLCDILAPMQYAFAFAEFVKTDPSKQYAMSHMEGLCAHLSQLDYGDLRKRSAALLEEFVSAHPSHPLA
jgi:hypothetical protein